jgi:hypothetical protein
MHGSELAYYIFLRTLKITHMGVLAALMIWHSASRGEAKQVQKRKGC